MGEVHNSYPVLDAFSKDIDDLRALGQSQNTLAAQSNSVDSQQRKHAACDECRKRKLKCSGEPAGCSRCVKNSIPCVYSQQKPMGRPRKRQKLDRESNSPGADEVAYTQPAPPSAQAQYQIQSHSHAEAQSDTPIDPSLANIDQDLTNFHNVCPGPMAQTIRNQRVAETIRVSVEDSANLFEQNGGSADIDYSYATYPTDISLWPDFSTMDKLPLPLTSKYDANPANDVYYTGLSTASTVASDTAHSHYDPDVDPTALASLPSVPACPCLPNLYLALSTLSTLASFPVAQHTLDTLLSAHKTAHSVIYCSICPQQFQSGSQNLMLGCTLLNVLADAWHRVRKTTPEALKKGFSTSPTKRNGSIHSQGSSNGNANGNVNNTNDSFIGVKEGLAWRNFVRQIIRAYVFGDASIPTPPSRAPPTPSLTSSSPPSSSAEVHNDASGPKVAPSSTLTFLISALERRQRQWHRLDELTDEFPDRPQYEYYNNHGEPQVNGNGNRTCHGNHHPPRHGGDADSLLCLMIVGHSRDIVRQLANDQ